MDFNDTPQESEFRKEVRAWLAANAPKEIDIDALRYKDDLAPFKNWQKKKAEAGWAAVTWPKGLGGRGGTPIQQVIWNQEEGMNAWLSMPFIIGMGMAGATIMTHGTKEQTMRYVPPMSRGDEIWCQLFSEPSAGSDLAGVRTKAVKDDGHRFSHGTRVMSFI